MAGLLFLIALLAVPWPEVEVRMIDGPPSVGRLEQLTAEQVTLQTADGEANVPLAQVLSLAPKKTPIQNSAVEKPLAWIELVDGSKLTANQFTVQKKVASVGFGKDEHAEFPAAAIRTVRFSSPDDPKAAAWPTDAGTQASGDLLVVRTKSGIDLMEGVVGDVTDERVEFKVQDETVPAQRAKIDGLIFFHKASEKTPDAACTVDDSHGWRLKAKSVALVDGQLSVTTLAGPTFVRPIDSVTRLDYSAGKVVYLSDLEPELAKWTPYLDFGNAAPALAQFYAPRRDEGREHQPLRLGGKTYAKGLSLYSRTAMEYRLPSGVTKFKATAGIDDAVRPAGNVRLLISADGKQIFDRSLTGADALVDLDLNVSGARRLSILVDYGDNQDAGDYLDLADARMLK